MKSTSELINLMYDFVASSELSDEVTGNIYKRMRPVDSLTEDIVINCLPTGNAQVQDATVNVNIYVNDLQLKIAGVKQIVPNTKRIQELEAIATAVFTNVNSSSYFFDIEFIGVIQEAEIKQHYVNVRINLKYITI